MPEVKVFLYSYIRPVQKGARLDFAVVLANNRTEADELLSGKNEEFAEILSKQPNFPIKIEVIEKEFKNGVVFLTRQER